MDQFGRRFIDPNQEHLFSVSLNSNNPQGALLWGIRSNYSYEGVLQLNNLVISQSGPIELKVSIKDIISSSSSSSNHDRDRNDDKRLKLVEVFHLIVQEDPVLVNTAPCLYVLKTGFCPSGTPAADWESEFPRIRSYVSPRHYLLNAFCSADTLQTWYVDATLIPDGSLWVEYRLGIDSIWTGIGMPRIEMNPEERLGLYDVSTDSSRVLKHHYQQGNKVNVTTTNISRSRSKKRGGGGRSNNKALKRAYYRKSLQWHPDRWVGLGMYTYAVQGAFELINEAYQLLSSVDDSDEEDAEDTVVVMPVVEPVFE